MKKRFENTVDFVRAIKSIHGDRFDYSNVIYTGINNKIIIKCKIHGAFEQTPNNHLLGKGCKKCRLDRDRKGRQQFLDEANIVHENRYDYSESVYVNYKKKLIIKCKTHGVFKQTPSTHLRGAGCIKCFHDKQKKTIGQFILDAHVIHENRYDYSDVVYNDSATKVIIVCKTHGKFKQLPVNHLSGHGCPVCKNFNSKGENLVSKLLDKSDISYHKNHRFLECRDKRTLPFDFYLPKLNACIEYDGIQHYMPIIHFGGTIGLLQRNRRDLIKDRFCNSNNIHLLRVKYDDPAPKETVLNFIKILNG